MTIPKNNNDLSVWQAEILRVTCFPSSTTSLSATNWWENVIGEPPENTSVRAREGLRQEEGIVNDKKIVLGVQPTRIDWVMQSTENENLLPIGAFGAFTDNLDSFLTIISRWLKIAPPLTRIAFGSVLSFPVDTRETGYELLAKYLPKVQCFLSDQNACQPLLNTTYLNRVSVKEQTRTKTENILKNHLNQNISLKDLQANFVAADFEDFLPLDSELSDEVFVASAETYTVLKSDGALDFSSSAVLIFDQDQDGLSDDLEAYYGTDIYNPDTDNDTYLDGQEVANNYNPLGGGTLDKDINDLVKVLHQRLNIDQPKNHNLISNDLSIDEFTSTKDNLILKGKAPANTWLNLYIYSKVPLLLSVKSDSQGDWEYNLEQALAVAEHKIYLTVNDQQGKILKQSMPLALKIDEQKQVNDSQDLKQLINNNQAFEIKNNVNFWLTYRWYILGVGTLIIIFLATYLFFKFRETKKGI